MRPISDQVSNQFVTQQSASLLSAATQYSAFVSQILSATSLKFRCPLTVLTGSNQQNLWFER